MTGDPVDDLRRLLAGLRRDVERAEATTGVVILPASEVAEIATLLDRLDADPQPILDDLRAKGWYPVGWFVLEDRGEGDEWEHHVRICRMIDGETVTGTGFSYIAALRDAQLRAEGNR